MKTEQSREFGRIQGGVRLHVLIDSGSSTLRRFKNHPAKRCVIIHCYAQIAHVMLLQHWNENDRSKKAKGLGEGIIEQQRVVSEEPNHRMGQE